MLTAIAPRIHIPGYSGYSGYSGNSGYCGCSENSFILRFSDGKFSQSSLPFLLTYIQLCIQLCIQTKDNLYTNINMLYPLVLLKTTDLSDYY